MFHYYNIAAYKYSFFSKICHTIANKWDIFTCYCKQNISIIRISSDGLLLLICMRNTLIKPDMIHGMNFSVSNTRYSCFTHFIPPYTSPTIPLCSNFPKRLILHPVRTVLPYQLF